MMSLYLLDDHLSVSSLIIILLSSRRSKSHFLTPIKSTEETGSVQSAGLLTWSVLLFVVWPWLLGRANICEKNKAGLASLWNYSI